MEQDILARIQFLKKEMVSVAEVKGLNDMEVLRISQEIDRLHNQLNRIKYEYVLPTPRMNAKQAMQRKPYVRELPLAYGT